MSYLDKNWKDMLKEKFDEKSGDKIWEEILATLPKTQFQPKEEEDIFKVFEMPIDKIKVVILGQDPYHTKGKATGYAFAVPLDFKRGMQGSLSAIKKEIENEVNEFGLDNRLDLGKKWRTLEHWTKNESGVFLLNTALTVKIGERSSHLELWEDFTKKVIEYISKNHPCIWMLWGKKAQKFKENICNTFDVKVNSIETIEEMLISDKINYILETSHPSPKSNTKGFKGCNHFLNVNKILKKLGKDGIKW